jgi:phosphoribosylpyrophosphate synthetase
LVVTNSITTAARGCVQKIRVLTIASRNARVQSIHEGGSISTLFM